MDNVSLIVKGAVAAWGLKVVAAVVVFVVGKWLAGVLAGALRRGMARTRQDEMLTSFLGNIVYYALLAFVILAVLAQLGVQTTSFIAVIGAAELAIGLALQGSLANFAAGVMLILFRPFKVGDYVEAGGTAGTVEEILIFSTKLKSPDNRQIFVPNGSIFSGNITNYSAKDTRRVDLVFGCSYDDDLRRVRAVLEDVVRGDERVLSEPAPVVAVNRLGESSVDFVVRPWVKGSRNNNFPFSDADPSRLAALLVG